MKPIVLETWYKGKSNKKIYCTLEKLHYRLYFLRFRDPYDMCMSFLRLQERYESPNSKFRDKNFTILDFMEWYSKEPAHSGAFTYPWDWAGFNLPSTVLESEWYRDLKDKNKYDEFMLSVYYLIWHDIKYGNDSFFGTGIPTNFGKDGKSPKYYLIGAMDPKCISHEMAHGFYFLNPTYKKQMDALTKALPKSFTNKVYKWLAKIGYTPKVFKDEMQAYMSTGFGAKNEIQPGKLSKPFEDVFKNARGIDGLQK